MGMSDTCVICRKPIIVDEDETGTVIAGVIQRIPVAADCAGYPANWGDITLLVAYCGPECREIDRIAAP